MTYLIISKKVGLNIAQQGRYLHFMNKRFSGQENAVCMGGLAERWANIIKTGTEMQYATELEKGILATAPKAETVVLPKVEPVAVEMSVLQAPVMDVAKPGDFIAPVAAVQTNETIPEGKSKEPLSVEPVVKKGKKVKK